MNKNTCTTHQIKLYKSQLQSILAHLAKDNLTFEQLYLICYESSIKFYNQEVQTQLREIFNANGGMLPVRDCFNTLQLQSCEILHNRPIFYVSVVLGTHPQRVCFHFWKEFMTNKYGSQMRWFDIIAQQAQCRRLKSYFFKQRLKIILKGTPHENCCDIICHKFPKNAKNEIEWSTFMQIVRQVQKKYWKLESRIQSKQLTEQFTIDFFPTELEPNQNEMSQEKYSKQKQLHMYLNWMKQKTKLRANKPKDCHKGLKSSMSQMDRFMMLSSFEIHKHHQQITQKFRVGDNVQQKRSANSIKRIHSAKKKSSLNTTAANWKQEISLQLPTPQKMRPQTTHYIHNIGPQRTRFHSVTSAQTTKLKPTRYVESVIEMSQFL